MHWKGGKPRVKTKKAKGPRSSQETVSAGNAFSKKSDWDQTSGKERHRLLCEKERGTLKKAECLPQSQDKARRFTRAYNAKSQSKGRGGRTTSSRFIKKKGEKQGFAGTSRVRTRLSPQSTERRNHRQEVPSRNHDLKEGHGKRGHRHTGGKTATPVRKRPPLSQGTKGCRKKGHDGKRKWVTRVDERKWEFCLSGGV